MKISYFNIFNVVGYLIVELLAPNQKSFSQCKCMVFNLKFKYKIIYMDYNNRSLTEKKFQL